MSSSQQVGGFTAGFGTLSIMRCLVDAWVSEEREFLILFIRGGDNSLTRKRPLLNFYKGPGSRQT